MTPRGILPVCRSADVRSVCLGACRDHSNHDGKSGDLAGGNFGKNRRHHRMDQQGRLCLPRDGAKRRLGLDIAAGEDRLSLLEPQSG
jgi:hypothetical protein